MRTIRIEDAKVWKTGNSLVITIPNKLAVKNCIKINSVFDEVTIKFKKK